MKNKLHQIIQYFKYLKAAQSSLYIHSPFVYDFYNNVLLPAKKLHIKPVEDYRISLKLNRSKITIEDFGAKGINNPIKLRRIQDIEKTAAVSPKYGNLLFQLVQYFQPNTILELGTNLGLGTFYMACAKKDCTIHTIEGAKNIHTLAKNKLEILGNIYFYLGHFDTVLPTILEKTPSIDIVFVDGNHQKAPTLEYVHKLLKKTNKNTLIILDDIYWSPDMTSAWKEIKDNEAVTMTIDLFQFGLVFVNPIFKEKQHFVLRY